MTEKNSDMTIEVTQEFKDWAEKNKEAVTVLLANPQRFVMTIARAAQDQLILDMIQAELAARSAEQPDTRQTHDQNVSKMLN